MGSPKAWLRFNNESLLERMVRLSLEAQSQQIILVLGAEENSAEHPGILSRAAVHQMLPQKLRKKITTCIGSPMESPIQSIRKGLSIFSPTNRVLLWPVDCPFASHQLLRTMLDSFATNEDCIARPAWEDRHGHPVLFGVKAANELQSPLADKGAREIVHRVPTRVLDLPFSDPKIFANLNTPHEATQLGVQLP